MTFWICGAIGALGLVAVISRRTLLGVMIGIQLLVLGATLLFVLAGAASGVRIEGHLFGLFITFSGIAQLVAGLALAIRLFYLRSRNGMDELRSLKR